MACLVLPLDTVIYNELAQAEQEYNAARQDLQSFRESAKIGDREAAAMYRFLLDRREAARLRYYGLL